VKTLLLLSLAGLSFGQSINVKSSPYNAQGNGLLYSDGAMNGSGGSGSLTFSCSATCYLSGSLMNFTGVNSTSPIDVSGSASGSSVTATAPSVTTTAANDMLLVAFGLNAIYTAPSSPAQAAMVQYSATTSVGNWAGTETIASAGATPTVPLSLSTSAQWAVLSIALKASGTISLTAATTAAPAFGSSLTFSALSGSVGDVQVACIAPYGTATLTPPAGWTLIASAGSGGQRETCYWMTVASTSGSALTSSNATFTSGDVGKLICVAQVGGSGTELCTTIASFVNAHQVNLTAASQSSSSLTNLEFVYATDDTAAIASALAAACGGELLIPPGIYGESAQQTACTTNSNTIKGYGNTLPDYLNNSTGAVYGGNSASTLWWLTKSMSTGAGLYFGSGISTTPQQNAAYRYPVYISGLSILAGVGGNHDGACATCSGLYLNAVSPLSIDRVTAAGWGQDGATTDTTWRASVENSMFTSNGRYGFSILASYTGNSNYPQNMSIRDSDISFNQLDGVYGVFVGGLSLLNDVIQWNDQATQAGHYELNVSSMTGFVKDGARVSPIGCWFEFPKSSGPYNPSAAMVGSFLQDNIFLSQ
jgi:hypothetical protein